MEILIGIGIFSLIFVLQFLLTLKLKNFILRLLPTAFWLLASGVLFALAYIIQGWDALALILLAAYAVAATIVSVCAFMIATLLRVVLNKRK